MSGEKIQLTIQEKAALNWHIKELYKTTILESTDNRLNQPFESFFKERWEDLVLKKNLDREYLADIVNCYEKETSKRSL